MPLSSANSDGPTTASDYFDELYHSAARYWWQADARYSPNPDDHPTSMLTQMTLRLIRGRPPGRALDLGAGEGADAIRLALMGYDVHAVEISKVGAEKISAFAAEVGTSVRVEVADVCHFEPDGEFDVVLSKGILHYVADKLSVIEKMQRATRSNGINVISLWSTYTPVPRCHSRVPVFCDDENGMVKRLYRDWITEFSYFDRNKKEKSHIDMPAHTHSHIKMISRKP